MVFNSLYVWYNINSKGQSGYPCHIPEFTNNGSHHYTKLHIKRKNSRISWDFDIIYKTLLHDTRFYIGTSVFQ